MRAGGSPLLAAATLLAAASASAQLPKEAGPTAYKIGDLDTAHGDREFVYLWADRAPGAVGDEALAKPKLTIYRAPADQATGTAVVVCPGGGYRVVASDHEGRQVAEWLNGLGVSAFVLRYRLGPRYRHTAPLHRGSGESLLGKDADPALLESLSNETQVTAQTPPTFLWHTNEDTGVPPENSILFYTVLRQAKVPAELHVFAKGPHGIGMAPADPAASLWPALCGNWLRAMGFLSH